MELGTRSITLGCFIKSHQPDGAAHHGIQTNTLGGIIILIWKCLWTLWYTSSSPKWIKSCINFSLLHNLVIKTIYDSCKHVVLKQFVTSREGCQRFSTPALLTFRPDESMLWGPFLCDVGYLPALFASPH